MSKFEIKRTITEGDIPAKRSRMESKYEPVMKALNTLEKDEGVEIEFEKAGAITQIKLVKDRFPRRHYHITQRGSTAYIICKQ